MSGRARHSVRAADSNPFPERRARSDAPTLLALRQAGELWDVTKCPVVLGFDICALRKQSTRHPEIAFMHRCDLKPKDARRRQERGWECQSSPWRTWSMNWRRFLASRLSAATGEASGITMTTKLYSAFTLIELLVVIAI